MQDDAEFWQLDSSRKGQQMQELVEVGSSYILQLRSTIVAGQQELYAQFQQTLVCQIAVVVLTALTEQQQAELQTAQDSMQQLVEDNTNTEQEASRVQMALSRTQADLTTAELELTNAQSQMQALVAQQQQQQQTLQHQQQHQQVLQQQQQQQEAELSRAAEEHGRLNAQHQLALVRPHPILPYSCAACTRIASRG